MDDLWFKVIARLLIQILEAQEAMMTTFQEGLDQLKAVTADIQANVAKIPTGGGTPTGGEPTPEKLAELQTHIDALVAVNQELMNKQGGATPPPPPPTPPGA